MPPRLLKALGELVGLFSASSAVQLPQLAEGELLTAKGLYMFRRKRDDLFGSLTFGEPAWDMLLDLYHAEQQGKAVSITSACIAASVPSTTALRWINALVSQGYLHRQPDPADGRRAFLSLTVSAREKLDSLFGHGAA